MENQWKRSYGKKEYPHTLIQKQNGEMHELFSLKHKISTLINHVFPKIERESQI